MEKKTLFSEQTVKIGPDSGYDNYIMSEVTFVPNNYVTLDDEVKEKALSLIEQLEDLDDVQNVYHNLDI